MPRGWQPPPRGGFHPVIVPVACDAISFGCGEHRHWHRSCSSATTLPITVIVRSPPSDTITPGDLQAAQNTAAPR